MDAALTVRLMVTAGLSVALSGAAMCLVMYVAFRAGRGPVFVPVGRMAPPGNGFTVAAAFAAYFIAAIFVQTILHSSGFYRRIYGSDFPDGWSEQAAATLQALWAALFAFPLQIAAMIGIVRSGGGSLGSWREPSRHVVGGYLTWLLITPLAFCIFALANLAHSCLTGEPPDQHPLTALGAAGGRREWTLFVFQTVLFAPILEELLFRGILMGWLAQTQEPDPDAPLGIDARYRALGIMLLAVATAFLFHRREIEQAVMHRDAHLAMVHLMPTAFFIALLPLLDLLPRWRGARRYFHIRSRQHVRAMLASSALFAAVHANVWPSPVPLLVLALGLAYLYIRTRSLVGPILVHAMFNAVSAVYLLLGGPT